MRALPHWGVAKLTRHQVLTLEIVGSSPTTVFLVPQGRNRPSWLQSIKVMQRAVNTQNTGQYRVGPPLFDQ